MEYNEENTDINQQSLLLNYLIQSIQKQQNRSVDSSSNFSEPTSILFQNKQDDNVSNRNRLNANEDLLKQFHKYVQQTKEHLTADVRQQGQVVNCISKSSPVERRSSKSNDPSSPQIQDDAYWERRKKNNEAAKRSRDARRAKEDEIALRAALLEQENIKLRLENAQLQQENIQLRFQIYTSSQ